MVTQCHISVHLQVTSPMLLRGQLLNKQRLETPLLLVKTGKGKTVDNLIHTNTRHLLWGIPRSIRSSLFQGYLPMLSAAVVGQIERLLFICQGILSDQILTKKFEIPIHGWLFLYIFL